MTFKSELVARLGITIDGDRMVDGLWRGDGRLERICEHGVGHTVADLSKNKNFVHGCDGCCRDYAREGED